MGTFPPNTDGLDSNLRTNNDAKKDAGNEQYEFSMARINVHKTLESLGVRLPLASED